jgi:hypothetical protein
VVIRRWITDTVNSRGAGFGPDVLTTFGDLLSWGVRIGVIEAAERDGLRGLAGGQGEVVLGPCKGPPRSALWAFAAHKSAAAAQLDLLQREVCAAQKMRVLVPGADNIA